jgi:PKD repeat protein
MKRKIYYFIILLMTLNLNTGCEDKELGNPLPSTVADFSYTVSNGGYAPCEVTFTNLSLNATGYLWDFGNGQTSTEINPVAHYDSIGSFAVTLTSTPVNNVYYNQSVKTLMITTKDPNAGKTLVLYFTQRNPTGGSGNYVILSDTTKTIYDFDFAEMNRPYGVVADTASRHVFISDFNVGAIFRFDADGKNPLKILDITVAGQEVVGDAEAMMFLGNTLYFGRTGGIFSCNIDGTNVDTLLYTGTTAPEFPIDMQLDTTTGKIFFVNDKTDYSGGLYTVNLDGSGVTMIIPGIDGTAIEADSEHAKLYLAIYDDPNTPEDENGIWWCGMDGSNLAKIGDYGAKATWGIAVDHENQKLFWSYKDSNSDPDGKIIRSNLDGSGAEDWVTGVCPHAMEVVWIKL